MEKIWDKGMSELLEGEFATCYFDNVKTTYKNVSFAEHISVKNIGQISRDDGPALIINGDSLWWYRNGLLHNMTGPAVLRMNDGKLEDEYHINGFQVTYEEWNKLKRKYKIDLLNL